MVDGSTLELRHGDLELDLRPASGGVITGFRHRGHDLMRPATAAYAEAGDPGQSSCFPLVPFSNRVADASFSFGGQRYALPRNFPPEPHAIHGQGWQTAWTVLEAGATTARLGFDHAVGATPLTYRAEQTFALDDDGLTIAIGVTNTGDGPMPAGIGLHSYFVRTEGVTLRASPAHVWLADARKLPEEQVLVPAHWDFAGAARVSPLSLDHCFGGWDGKAEIRWPETGVSLRIDADPVFGHVVVYVPPGEDFFCVEPVSHVNDGFNLLARGVRGTGVRILAAGDSLSGTIRFRPG